MRITACAAFLFVAFSLLAAPPSGTIQVTHVTWNDAPPTMPAGTKIAVLEGDPKKPGLFTIRLKVPAGSVIAPHWHPRPERVTVLAGHVLVGFSDVVDEKSATEFTDGGFYVNARKAHHWVKFAEDTVLQLTCEGPWELNYLK
ncbi:MAG TPA: cupin domain-containing protein [Thermoanaerobaculia bacterium]|nr:cupin domain-containing protein [Thermoanaerobaculia bacterium]